jgi:hypothetical protein
MIEKTTQTWAIWPPSRYPPAPEVVLFCFRASFGWSWEANLAATWSKLQLAASLTGKASTTMISGSTGWSRHSDDFWLHGVEQAFMPAVKLL